ncbi:ICOS ligand-like [Clupea harengus]|uniref:ICOS ligand-like n=1 Tax=Clupea harengus TaxID=7950 RepID=A0A6P8FQH1_CLUHA|nr:ICOS ligand-like [Clupea harengus]
MSSCHFLAMTPRWFIALLLGLVRQGSSQDDDCTVGVIGESAVLPCTYDGRRNLPSSNISVQWRSETEEMFRRTWSQGLDDTTNMPDSNMPDSSRARMSTLAPQTRDFSMTLSDIVPPDSKNYSLHVSFDGEETSSVLCTTCLRVGAHFSFPVIQRDGPSLEDEPSLEDGPSLESETRFVCHTRGGYPQPTLHWLINATDSPALGAVRTYSEPLPDSELYNITSILTVSIAKHTPVACAVENHVLNETFSTTNWPEEDQFSPVVARASEAMWFFSTVLIVIVGLLVALGTIFQVKWDRERRRPRLHREDSDSEDTDIITVDLEHLEHLDSLPETDV